MKTRLLSTVAASLLLTGGIAMAQSLPAQKEQAPARAPAAQQNAPAEKVAPPMHKGSETTGQSSHESTSTGTMNKSQSTSQTPKADEENGKSSSTMNKGAADTKADSKSAADSKKNETNKNASETTKSDTNKSASESGKSDMNKNAADTSKSGSAAKSSTTGQGAAAGQAKLSGEQRTKITTAFKSDKSLKSVSKSEINVSISVGTKIPSHVHVYPVPAEVISVYPEWRGYDVILVDGEYLIIEPQTREIVYIIT